ncbi:MAG: hypothetical protein HY326_08450 [Chloroflexi bacterium]|nr:hypothetical protein [Chloroflexota bacterium]
MAKRQPNHTPGLLVRNDQPLIGVLTVEGGQEVVRYFVDEQDADAAAPQDSIQQALSLAGVWSDLDWEEMETALDRIRHESLPTPPITEL